jgi:hypothetical protein
MLVCSPLARVVRRFFFLIAYVCFISLSLSKGVAQDYLTATGSPTFGILSPVENGFTNLSNGNLHLEIDLGNFPQRGKKQLSTKLVYDARIWQINSTSNSWQPTNVANSLGGWRFVTTYDPGTVSQTLTTTTCGPSQVIQTWQAFVWTDPLGTQRVFPITTTQNQCTGVNTATGDAYAEDSSGFHMYVTNFQTATVFGKDGAQVYPSAKDTNGNFFSTDANGNLIDTLNRTPVKKTVSGSNIFYDVLNSQGGTSRFTVSTVTVNANTAFGQSGVTEYSGAFTAIQSITLPDGTSYSFAYDTGLYGLLANMTLRTGGVVHYGYTNFTDAYGNINRWLTSRTASGTWSYAPQVLTSCAAGTIGCQQQVTVGKPSGDQTVHVFTLNNGSWESQTQYFAGSSGTGTLFRSVAKDYDFSNSCPLAGCFGNAYIRVIRSTTTDTVPSGNIFKKTEYIYDSINLGNFSALKEWYYYTGAPSTIPDRETDYAYLTATAYANKDIHDRVTSATVKNAAGTQISQTLTTYDSGSITNIAGVTHHDDANFGTSNTVRGNATLIQRWVVGSSFLNTSVTYDTTGQILASTNPRGHSHLYSYADAFYNDANPPVNPPTSFTAPVTTNAYVSQITVNETAGAGSLHYGYYYGTGKLASDADINLATIFHHYVDPLDRETHAYDRKLINNTRGWSLTVYTSSTQTDTFRGIVDTAVSASCVSCRHDQKTVDGFGRLTNSTLVNDPGGAVKVDVGFDFNDRPQTQSNPYRSSTDPTYGTETDAFDALDRIVSQTHADGNVARRYYGSSVSGAGGIASQLCSTSTYGVGYPVLEVDEAGKKLQRWTNAFNSVIEVDEPDSSNNLTQTTCYGYDARQNNTSIVQGAESRTYAYDGIARVTTSNEPESGTTTFFYTASDGSICSGADDICRKTDARGITATYIYDIGTMKDRLNTITYSDGTATTNYFYDQTTYNGLTITYGGDRRTGMSDGSGQTAWSYDPVGHIITERRTNGAATDVTSYTYNVDGSTASITYPSGRVINYTFNNAQQEVSVVDATSSTNYITNATYSPQGALSSAVHGLVSGGFAGVTETYTYNNRLQIATHTASSSAGSVLSHTYSYDQGGGINNGNIISLANNLNTGRTQSFTYDTLNRLASAQSQATTGTDCWGDNYGYDRYGNLLSMTVTKCSAQNLSVAVDGSNHIVGMSYDAGGNLTNDGSHTYTWDAENRLTNTAATNYKFDGNSLRVSKGTNDLYWYSAASCRHPLFGRSTAAGVYTDEFVHFNGQPVGYRDDTAGQAYHVFTDHLGSVRAMTNTVGVKQFESDYFPHGAPRPITTTKDVVLKFEAKQLDTESGLSNVRKMYSPTLARFMPGRGAALPQPPQPSTKPKAVPPPQALNSTSLAASNPVLHPDSLVGGIGNIVRTLLAPSEGSEGNCPCCAFGCFPGPPDFAGFPLPFVISLTTCSCNNIGNIINTVLLTCVYSCRCADGDTAGSAIGLVAITAECRAVGSPVPHGKCPLRIETKRIRFQIFGDGEVHFDKPTFCSNVD